MKSIRVFLFLLGPIFFILFLQNCRNNPEPFFVDKEVIDEIKMGIEEEAILYEVKDDISIESYFTWIESLCTFYNSEGIQALGYQLIPQVLIHHNPWIIDSFRKSDYYLQKEVGNFQYDQRKQVIIPKGSVLSIPGKEEAQKIDIFLASISIDINIPEYKLRLLADQKEIFSFLIRVGQNRTKFLTSEGRDFDLRTKTGKGKIADIILSPKYTNFNTGEVYEFTRRDDKITTLMPLIPTLEPEINGICYGQLIHPTTNPNTLGKAYSHGCIGTREEDAWILFFYSRIGTPIEIRYSLEIENGVGEIQELEDIYDLRSQGL
ncbi:MAG: L,D-transpeptidase [Bacteroidota bacterium]